MRIEIFTKKAYADGRSGRILKSLQHHLNLPVTEVKLVDVYLLEGIDGLDEKAARDVFLDPVAQDILAGECAGSRDLLPGWDLMIEVAYKPGVTDQVGLTARDALGNYFGHKLPEEARVQTAAKYLFRTGTLSRDETMILLDALHNKLIQTASAISRDEWQAGKRFPSVYPFAIGKSVIDIGYFPIQAMNDAELQDLSKQRLLALTLAEMKSVQEYFSRDAVRKLRASRGLKEGATDVELEMIGQTWS
jgi:phosphoribosylformylglycinamidine synthase subunit PurSL